MSSKPKQEEVTQNQHIRFHILVPFYNAMNIKRQNEEGKLTKESAHPIYDATIDKIEKLINSEVTSVLDELEKQAFDDLLSVPLGKAVSVEAIQSIREKYQ